MKETQHPRHRCGEHGAALIPSVQGELSGLEAQLVRAHLDGCERCRATADLLGRGLDAARGWIPDVDPNRIEELAAQAATQAPAATPWRRWALAVVPVLMVLIWGGIHLGQESSPSASQTPTTASATIPSAPELRRRALSPNLRMVYSDGHPDGWLAQQEGTTARVHAGTREAGLAMFSFRGGEGRRLEVVVPGAVIRVVGTRFFVDVGADGEPTTVGVVEGRVEVQLAASTTVVAAGTSLSFDADGRRVPTRERPAVLERLSDPWLVELKEEPSLVEADPPPATGGGTAGRRRGLRVPEVLEALRRAEERARRGDHRAAIAVYTELIDDSGTAVAPYRDLCRYERARIAGFGLGNVERARRQLEALARRAEGEVRRQALLTLCELQLSDDRCAARRCLEGLNERADFELRREAERLVEAWNLHDACSDD